MLRIRRKLYFEHFHKHVDSLQKHINEEDYIQAAEKVWGALSSFVNAFNTQEVKGARNKKESFETWFHRLAIKKTSLRKILKDNDFKNAWDFATVAEGLHKYFFGAKDYNKEFLRKCLIGCNNVLREMRRVLIQEMK